MTVEGIGSPVTVEVLVAVCDAVLIDVIAIDPSRAVVSSVPLDTLDPGPQTQRTLDPQVTVLSQEDFQRPSEKLLALINAGIIS